jgi:hypothetical protein
VTVARGAARARMLDTSEIEINFTISTYVHPTCRSSSSSTRVRSPAPPRVSVSICTFVLVSTYVHPTYRSSASSTRVRSPAPPPLLRQYLYFCTGKLDVCTSEARASSTRACVRLHPPTLPRQRQFSYFGTSKASKFSTCTPPHLSASSPRRPHHRRSCLLWQRNR